MLTVFIVKRSLPFRHNHLENGAMNSATIGCVFLQTYRAVVRNHTLHMAAALSYYLALSLFPAMILLSAIVAHLPVPNLLDHALDFMALLVPSDSTGLISRVLRGS